MTIHVALNHITRYRYDRPVALSPQIVRLRYPDTIRTIQVDYVCVVDLDGGASKSDIGRVVTSAPAELAKREKA